MNRNLWAESYLETNPPFWPCPACGRETLQPIAHSLKTAFPSGYSRRVGKNTGVATPGGLTND